MRVGYELTALELDATGSARAIDRLRLELEQVAGLELVTLAHPGAGGHRLVRGVSRELAYLPLRLPRRARSLRLDLLHCPAALAPGRSRVPVCLTVHDVMTFDRPDWFTRANVLQQRLTLPRAARNAAVVTVPSGHTRARAIEVLDLDADRVRVCPWGIDDRFRPGQPSDGVLERLGVERPYVLTVAGALQPRKNVETAVRAFERLVAAGAREQLVVVGSSGWRDEESLRAIRQGPAASRVHLTGRVEDAELIDLYRGAECFVFPSLYEGFGFPPLEAMACGTPTVCSDRASLPELVGDAATLVDPDDPESLERALTSLLESPDRRRELGERGRKRAAGYSWRRCAELTVGAYEQALAS